MEINPKTSTVTINALHLFTKEDTGVKTSDLDALLTRQDSYMGAGCEGAQGQNKHQPQKLDSSTELKTVFVT